MRRAFLTAAFLLCAALVIACGGGTPQPTRPLTPEEKAELAAKAKARQEEEAKAQQRREFRQLGTRYHMRRTPAEEKRQILVQVVEFYLVDGRERLARTWVKQGLEDSIEAEYPSQAAKDLLAAVRKELEEEKAARLVREREERQRRAEEKLASITLGPPGNLTKFEAGCVIGNRLSKKYHVPGSRGYDRNKKSEHTVFFRTVEDAKKAGYVSAAGKPGK